jgi:aminoglycoside phosphotransferase (APT) family kinase protein
MNAHPFSDHGGPIRTGEDLDVEAVTRWLRGPLPGLEGAPAVTQFSGGASNWTYRLEYPADGGEGPRDLILRRAPAGTKAASAHDMGREFRVQSALKPVYPLVAEMVGLCTDPAVLGTDFYVMRRIPGIILRKNLPRGMALSPAQARKLCDGVVDALVALHRVDPAACGLDALGKGTGYASRQIDGWSSRYEKARTWNVPSFAKVRGWLRDNTPDDVASCVIHNDWRLDNLVLDPEDPTRIIGVLDWEMSTIGDPLMELGSALAYWIEPDDNRLLQANRRQPTHLPGMMTRAELIDAYLDRSGLGSRISAREFTFYEVYGLFRLAVIAQQIYYRYHHGQTNNPAFRHFWLFVNYVDWRCAAMIRRARR